MPQGFEFGLASFDVFINYLEKDKRHVLIMLLSIIELDGRAKKLDNKIRIPRGLQQAEMIGQGSWHENEWKREA